MQDAGFTARYNAHRVVQAVPGRSTDQCERQRRVSGWPVSARRPMGGGGHVAHQMSVVACRAVHTFAPETDGNVKSRFRV